MKWRFLADVNFDSLLLVSKQSKTIRQPLITAFLYTVLPLVRQNKN